jgi:quinol monooxygenase YgiN
MQRREFLSIAGVAGAATPLIVSQAIAATPVKRASMYGLIGKMSAIPGKRDELAAVLLDGTGAMPGCLSYIVATDPADPDALWITEVWDSKASHEGSLALPGVKAAIAKGRPLIAGFSNRVETLPIGGQGISGSRGQRS